MAYDVDVGILFQRAVYTYDKHVFYTMMIALRDTTRAHIKSLLMLDQRSGLDQCAMFDVSAISRPMPHNLSIRSFCGSDVYQSVLF